MKLYLKDKSLSPVLSFMSKKTFFSEIITELYEEVDINIKLFSGESEFLYHNFVLSSNYYIQTDVFSAWSQRLSKGKLNIDILDGENIIGYYKCSPHAPNRAYDISQIAGIEIIDYKFVQNVYKTFRSRATNNVNIMNNEIIKESSNVLKIQNEFKFLASVQDDFSFYIPVFDLEVVDDKASYKMPLITPGDISSYFLNNQTRYFRENNFEAFCVNYFQTTMSSQETVIVKPNEQQITQSGIKEILRSRMHDRHANVILHLQSSSSADFNLQRSIIELLAELTNSFENLFKTGQLDFVSSSPLGKFHGDFCLSNILFDEKSKSYFLVDPRGDEVSPVCLDLAKLSHSLNGNYDAILAGRYHINVTNNGFVLNIADNMFFAQLFDNILEKLNVHSKTQIRMLEAFLFLTMIIFHMDDLERCLAFLLRSRDILLSVTQIADLELVNDT